MGVIRRRDDIEPEKVENLNEFNYADFEFSDSETEQTEATTENKKALPMSRTRRRREERAERKLRKFMNGLDNDAVIVKKNMGSRKQRRVENARLLMSFVDKDDICTDFSDIVPNKMSAFALLFEERENMRIWNEFILLEEVDQRRILENADRRNKQKEEKQMRGEGWFIVGGTPNPSSSKRLSQDDESESRRHHPTYSAKVCFKRIDKRCQQLLRQRNLPWEFVDYIERQLRDIYSADASAVWVQSYEDSLHRMIVHGLSQYLMLQSKSITDFQSKVRFTEVRNPRSFFVPPHGYLIPYLEQIRKEKIVFERRDDSDDALNCTFESLTLESATGETDC